MQFGYACASYGYTASCLSSLCKSDHCVLSFLGLSPCWDEMLVGGPRQSGLRQPRLPVLRRRTHTHQYNRLKVHCVTALRRIPHIHFTPGISSLHWKLFPLWSHQRAGFSAIRVAKSVYSISRYPRFQALAILGSTKV